MIKKVILDNLMELKGGLENLTDTDLIDDRELLLSIVMDTLEELSNE